MYILCPNMGRRSPSDNFLFLSFEEEEEKKTKEEKKKGEGRRRRIFRVPEHSIHTYNSIALRCK